MHSEHAHKKKQWNNTRGTASMKNESTANFFAA